MKRSRAPSLLHSRKVQKVDTVTSPSPLLSSEIVATKAPVVIKKAPIIVRRTPMKKFTPPTFKKPLSSTGGVEIEKEEIFLVYSVFWTKRSNKKHKTFADGWYWV